MRLSKTPGFGRAPQITGRIFFIAIAALAAAAAADQPAPKTAAPPSVQPQPSAPARKKQILFQRGPAAGGVPFKAEIEAEGLGVPWGMAFISAEELLFTERHGRLSRLHLPTGKITPIPGAPKAAAGGQGGLLDLALHPGFKQNRRVYFSYSAALGWRKKTTAIAFGILKDRQIKGLKTVFTARPGFASERHFGSRLAFDSEGFLFVTVGDRANKKEAQDLSSHMGSVLRLTDEGGAAPGNPFAKVRGALPEIWSFGHRNPQGLFWHSETKKLWAIEHGPKGGDELNLIRRGKNYGWPLITYGRSYAGFKIGEGARKKGMEQPAKYWVPSISPCGLMIYSGKKFPAWKGHFFAGALSGQHISRLKINGGRVIEEERLLGSSGLRFRNVIEGPEGFIYASADQGQILRLAPKRRFEGAGKDRSQLRPQTLAK